MRVDEDRMSQLLSDAADGTVDDAAVIREVENDLRFQAELVQYRKLLRALRSLRAEVVDPGCAIVDDILLALDEAADRHVLRTMVSGRRAAYLGGIAAATAAGVGGAIVLARRRRLAA